MLHSVLALSAFAALAALATSVTPVLKLPATKHYVAQEVKLKLEVHVPIHRDNRLVCVEWDSADGGAGRACRQLDEYTDWENHSFNVVLTHGDYVIRAVLVQATETAVTATQTLRIIDPRSPEN